MNREKGMGHPVTFSPWSAVVSRDFAKYPGIFVPG